MIKTENQYLTAIYNVYKTPEILAVPSDKWRLFDHGQPSTLSTYEKWMRHKYAHTFQVLREGVAIINKEPRLKASCADLKKQWMDALLLHDYGRAFEVSPKKEAYAFSFCHGVTGAQKAMELGETSLNVLVPILVHDQMNNDFVDASDEDFLNIPVIQNLAPDKRSAVLDIRKAYQKTSSQEKEIIRLGIGLVRDADMLSNLREYRKMLRFLEKEPVAKMNENVLRSMKAYDYVKFEDVQTCPDKSCMYLSWAFHFNFPSTFKEVLNARILERFVDDMFKKIEPFNPPSDILALRHQMNEVLDIIRAFDGEKRYKVPVESAFVPTRRENAHTIQRYLFQNKV